MNIVLIKIYDPITNYSTNTCKQEIHETKHQDHGIFSRSLADTTDTANSPRKIPNLHSK